ncbi:hypothetical protein SAMN05216464_10514 [Mucilaginibacter pineti]|uniref:DUF5017 domain-containing protein n=1 Tax=Mucilaginibacter pineti TaxID=1391627 RepID=A0A1G7BGK3_9SPHI|nr:hypothetical protein [Mucilaginibacter pineti]SDE26123.1 hypothetical protein SAMN05216464_10514 [Mucilaginibacter pineti]
MKKILMNILGIAAIATAISACHPMNKTYEAIGPVPTPNGTPQTFVLTLAAADYTSLDTGNYAYKSKSFNTKDDAAASIPTILAKKYPNYADKSNVTVTYATQPITVKPADSVFNNVAYTLVNPDDYLLLPGNTFIDFSASQILKWLVVKYPNAAANQLAVLTFIYYESGATATVTQSFLFQNGAWQKIYTISPAQYASVGKGGTNNNFSSGDAALLPAYFNTFLKADPAVSVTAKAGDVKYVSYKYFGGGTFQRVKALTFDGTNWTTTSLPQSLSFIKGNGVWVADNTVSYTLVTADYTTISNIDGVASADAIANLKAHGNFSQQSGSTSAWTDAQINAGIAVILKAKYPAAVVDQKFVVTISVYNGSATVNLTHTLKYDGTTFVGV